MKRRSEAVRSSRWSNRSTPMRWNRVTSMSSGALGIMATIRHARSKRWWRPGSGGQRAEHRSRRSRDPAVLTTSLSPRVRSIRLMWREIATTWWTPEPPPIPPLTGALRAERSHSVG